MASERDTSFFIGKALLWYLIVSCYVYSCLMLIPIFFNFEVVNWVK